MSVLNLAQGRDIYIMCGRVDMRSGIDGLAGLVKSRYDLDPLGGSLFLFCGRRADRFKGLYFDEVRGFVLIYVRLESGHFQWPRTPEEARRIDLEQYRRLLQGLRIVDTSTLGTVDKVALRASFGAV